MPRSMRGTRLRRLQSRQVPDVETPQRRRGASSYCGGRLSCTRTRDSIPAADLVFVRAAPTLDAFAMLRILLN